MQRLIDMKTMTGILSKHADETGYSLEMLIWGFEHMFAHWHRQELADFCHHEIPAFNPGDLGAFTDIDTTLDKRQSIVPAARFHRLFMVTASTVPSAAFQDIVLSLLLPVEVVVRPSENLLPLFYDLHDYLWKKSPLLAERLRIVETGHHEESLLNWLNWCDCLNVSGSNETVKYYQDLLKRHGLNPAFIPHGHRVSAALIRTQDLDLLTSQDYKNLALDLSAWDQMGCLSPKCLFIEADFEKCRSIAEKLMKSVDEWSSILPLGKTELSIQAQKNNAIRLAELDGSCVIHGQNHEDVFVIFPHECEFEPIFQPRLLNIYPVIDSVEAAIQLSPFGQAAGSLSPLGTHNEERLAQAGYNYFCRLGQMQDPPLTWLHDSIGTLLPLYTARRQQ